MMNPTLDKVLWSIPPNVDVFEFNALKTEKRTFLENLSVFCNTCYNRRLTFKDVFLHVDTFPEDPLQFDRFLKEAVRFIKPGGMLRIRIHHNVVDARDNWLTYSHFNPVGKGWMKIDDGNGTVYVEGFQGFWRNKFVRVAFEIDDSRPTKFNVSLIN
uniref:Uncharacterized protein n=1 Tax=Panagrolaimus sp. JU765 TaxID=591449 RepID=A0AC34RGD1_9BILA